MTGSSTSKHHERIVAVAAALKDQPEGLAVEHLRIVLAPLGMTDKAREQLFTKMRRRGMLVLFGKGKSARWFAPEHALAEAEIEERRLARRRLIERTAEERAAARFADKMPVHRVVRASDAPPLRPAGPCSVWGLA